ncbi:MAG: hypothetical protein KAG56_08555 [Sulfurovaceae bacterium]|nr:hypothetical protein [Sulfurovaceae bacterium]
MREPWVVYVVVLGTVAAMILGKFWMAGGGADNQPPEDETKEKDKTIEDKKENRA